MSSRLNGGATTAGSGADLAAGVGLELRDTRWDAGGRGIVADEESLGKVVPCWLHHHGTPAQISTIVETTRKISFDFTANKKSPAPIFRRW